MIKKVLISALWLTSCILTTNCLQAQSWGNWIDVGKGIQVSFKFGKKSCTFANTYARLRNTSSNTYCFVYVSFTSACDGTTNEMAVSANHLGPGQIKESPGDFYSTSLQVSNIRLTELQNEKCQTIVENGKTVAVKSDQSSKETQDKSGQQRSDDEDKRKQEEASRRQLEEKKTAQKKENQEREAKRVQDSIASERANARTEQITQQSSANASLANQMSTGVVGLMFNENLQDKEFDGKFLGWRALIGIGVENFPVISNTISGTNPQLNSSSLSSDFPITLTAGLGLSFFNKKIWRFTATPVGQFGVSFGSGTTGYYYSYGMEGVFSIGNNVRFEWGAGYYQRNLTEQTSADAVNQSVGLNTSSGDQYYSNFKHTLIRGMAGVSFRFQQSYTPANEKPKMGYLYLGCFADRPQYFSYGSLKPVPGVEIRYKAPGGFIFKGMYASNYPYSGDAAFKLQERKNGAYFSFIFGKIFALSK